MTEEMHQEDVAEAEVEADAEISDAGGGEDRPEPAVQRDPEAEAEARKYGWRPKEEFDRDPEGWVDAARFLELPSTHKKMLRDELRETKQEMADRLARLEKANKAAMERALEAQKAQYEAQLHQVRAAQRKAVEDGDTAAYDRLEIYERDLLKRAPTPARAEEQKPAPDPYVEQYRGSQAGQWLNDPYLYARAAEIIDLSKGAAGATAADQIAYAEARLKEFYPQKFAPAQPAKPAQARVDGGGLASGKRRSDVDRLPPEAVKAAKEFIEEGYIKSLEEYAKSYWESES